MRSVTRGIVDIDLVPFWLGGEADRQQPHRLTRGDDTYQAGDSGEYVIGLAGDDFIIGGDGEDHIKGSNGNDRLGGELGSDLLEGGDGDDGLRGGAGSDRLYGGDGDDQLNGEGGRDVFVGGLGADQIQVNDSSPDGRRDTVLYNSIDETAGDSVGLFQCGEDRIDLSALDANVLTPEDDAFHYIGSRAFSGAAGELRIGDGIEGDVNGDGFADFKIELQATLGTFTRHDFVL